MPRVATSAKWPTALAVLADIGLFTNDEAAILVADITNAGTTVQLDDATPFSVGMWLPVRGVNGLEVCQVTAVDYSLKQVTVTRAKDGTVGIAHAQGEVMKASVPAVALNQIRDELLAVETAIGSIATPGTGLPTLYPLADNAYDIGSPSRRWRSMYATGTSYYVYATVGAANPASKLGSALLSFGAGAGSALDVTLSRQAASVLEATGSLAGSVRYGLSGAATPFVELRAAAADANPGSQLLKDRLNFGAGGASALDVSLVRLGASALGGSADNVLQLGNATTRLASVSALVFQVHAASGDANPTVKMAAGSLQLGAGGASAVDSFLWRQAADVLAVGSSGALIDGAYYARTFKAKNQGSGGDPTFIANSSNQSWRSVGNINPDADNTYNFGTNALRWGTLNATLLKLFGAASDANEMSRASTTGFSLGAGGASALDAKIARQAASVFQVLDPSAAFAGDLRFGLTGSATPILSMRAAAADANPVAQLVTASLSFGAGGASAVDYILARAGANTGTLSGTLSPTIDNTYDLGAATFRWRQVYAAGMTTGTILPSADNTYDLGSSTFRWRDVYASGSSFRVIGTQSDANPTARLGSALLAFGAGGASATDVQFARQAASVAELTGAVAGSVRLGLTGAAAPFLALRAAAADANAVSQLVSTGLGIGAGGASAVDVTLLRTGANAATMTATSGFTVAGSVLPSADNTYDLGTASLRWRSVYATGSSYYVHVAAGDAQPSSKLASGLLAFGAGGASAVDVFAWRQAANVLAVGSSGALIDGTYYAQTVKFKNQAAGADPTIAANASNQAIRIAGNVNPDADNTYNMGTNAVRWQTWNGTSAKMFAAVSDANETARLSTTGMQLGAGGATALDAKIGRQQASVFNVTDPSATFAGDIRFGLAATGQPVVSLRLAAADANPVTRLDYTGLLYGAGGASATDNTFARNAASILQHTGSLAGDVRHGMSGAGVAFISGRIAAADANSAFHIDTTGILSFGVGGATARDVFIERVAPTANKLVHVGAAAGGTTGVWIDTTTPGVILKDAAGSPHYWRLTVDTAGALVTTDIGTSLP